MNTKNVSRVDIMVDLETLGKGDTPPIIQIAASAFDIKTGKVYSDFETYADVSTINNIEGGTLSWWLDTNADLLHTIIDAGKTSCCSESKCFSDFIDWIYEVTTSLGLTSKEVFLWGNGILFDNRIIKNKCKQFSFEYPIYYRNDMDVRTILEMAAFREGLSGQIAFRNTVEHIEPAHNAAIDVKNQIADVCSAYEVLMR